MEVFIDTGFFCAAANSKDPKNREAKDTMGLLEEKGCFFYTSDYVLDETYTLIRNRVNHLAAVKFMEGFKRSHILVKRVFEGIEDYAENIFIKYKDKNFSFTDCTSFAIIDAHKIDVILSFDNDFRYFKFRHPVEILP